MARYRKIDVRMWNDRKFRELSDNGKLAFILLLTHPDTTQIGTIRTRVSNLADELGWQRDAMSHAIQEVTLNGMIDADEKAGLMVINNFLKYNAPSSPNAFKSWCELIDLMPECDLLDKHVARLKTFVDGLSVGMRNAIPNDLIDAIKDAMSRTNGQPCRTQEQDQEQDQEQEHHPKAFETFAGRVCEKETPLKTAPVEQELPLQRTTVSKTETVEKKSNALYRSFLVFYNYFNMQFNLLNERFHADSMEKKLIKRYGMYARDALLVVTIPSVVAKLIEAVVFGDPDTGDDDEFGMDDMLRMLASESFKNAVAMAPIAGQFINTAGASLAKDQKGGAVSDVARFIWGTDPYVGRIMTAPAYSLIEGSGKAIQQTVEILNDEDVNARSYTRNMLDLLSVVTGLPLGFLKKPLGYMAGVEAGDIQPADAGEFVQGVLSGRAKKD